MTQKNPSFAAQILRGDSIYRALFNQRVAKYCSNISGTALDVAGNRHASYYRYLPATLKVTVTNLKGDDLDVEADFNKPLPFGDASFDSVFLFNAIYIADDQQALMQELRRVLKSGGKLFVASPYISNEMRDPHDYLRLTSEGLERLARESGLKIIALDPFGERFSAAAYLLNSFWLFAPIRLVVYTLALGLDTLISNNARLRHPTPLGYFCVLTR
jgi:SAM-dependent methyltransferase